MELLTTLSQAACSLAAVWCSQPALETYQPDPARPPLYITADAQAELGWVADEIVAPGGVPIMFLRQADLPGYYKGETFQTFNFHACRQALNVRKFPAAFLSTDSKNEELRNSLCASAALNTTGTAELIDKDGDLEVDAGIIVVGTPQDSLKEFMDRLAVPGIDPAAVPHTNEEILLATLTHERGHTGHPFYTDPRKAERFADQTVLAAWPDYVERGLPVSKTLPSFFEEWRHATSIGILQAQKDGFGLPAVYRREDRFDMASPHMTGYTLHHEGPLTREELLANPDFNAALDVNFLLLSFQAYGLETTIPAPMPAPASAYWRAQALVENNTNRLDALAALEVMIDKGWVDTPEMMDYAQRSLQFITAAAPDFRDTQDYRDAHGFYETLIPIKGTQQAELDRYLDEPPQLPLRPAPRP